MKCTLHELVNALSDKAPTAPIAEGLSQGWRCLHCAVLRGQLLREFGLFTFFRVRVNVA